MTDLHENDEFIEMDFERKMEWFKEEFKVTFGIPDSKTVYTDKDRNLYRSLLNKMCVTLNQYTHEPLLGKLVEVYNEVTMRYDEYMGE